METKSALAATEPCVRPLGAESRAASSTREFSNGDGSLGASSGVTEARTVALDPFGREVFLSAMLALAELSCESARSRRLDTARRTEARRMPRAARILGPALGANQLSELTIGAVAKARGEGVAQSSLTMRAKFRLDVTSTVLTMRKKFQI
jgi:hypothetical protein